MMMMMMRIMMYSKDLPPKTAAEPPISVFIPAIPGGTLMLNPVKYIINY